MGRSSLIRGLPEGLRQPAPTSHIALALSRRCAALQWPSVTTPAHFQVLVPDWQAPRLRHERTPSVLARHPPVRLRACLYKPGTIRQRMLCAEVTVLDCYEGPSDSGLTIASLLSLPKKNRFRQLGRCRFLAASPCSYSSLVSCGAQSSQGYVCAVEQQQIRCCLSASAVALRDA
jgi:hypothetical protein